MQGWEQIRDKIFKDITGSTIRESACRAPTGMTLLNYVKSPHQLMILIGLNWRYI